MQSESIPSRDASVLGVVLCCLGALLLAAALYHFFAIYWSGALATALAVLYAYMIVRRVRPLEEGPLAMIEWAALFLVLLAIGLCGAYAVFAVRTIERWLI